MTARYLLCPGPVRSRTDGQWHNVTAGQLADLYGVRMADCLVLPAWGDRSHRAAITERDLNARADRGELIRLGPRGDGDYSLPAPAAQRGHAMVVLMVFVAFMGILAAFFAPDHPRDSTDPASGPRSDLVVRVDELTGCQYLGDVRGGLTPRLDASGRPICDRSAPR